MSAARGDHPPPWTWIAALLLGLTGVVGCWLVGRAFGARYEALYLNLDRLTSAPDSPPTIVIIGSSRTWCAVESDSAMSHRLSLDGTPARVIRITQGGATLRDFASLFERLPNARPAAVVIESDLVTLEPNAFRMPGTPQYSDWREQSRHAFAVLLTPSLVARHGLENRDSPLSRCSFQTDAASESRRFKALAERRASSSTERAPVIGLAQRLRRLGVPVVLLDLPNRDDQIGLRPAALVQGEKRAMQQLLATGLFNRFEDLPKLTAVDFEDAGHVNARGQAQVSAWLASNLAATLRTSGHR